MTPPFMLAALATALLLGCGSAGEAAGASSTSETAQTAVSQRDLAIYEAVFRHQFGTNASSMKSSAPAYFLLIEGKDPSPSFLMRFESSQPPVRPGSEFQNGAGLLFKVDGIAEINSTTVDVPGGYYERGLSASGNTYRLELRAGKWDVTSDTMHWIS